jgi:RNA recognition motif-containing protein
MLSSTAPAYGESAGASSGPAEPIKLYVGNLGWDTSSEQLQQEFAAFGSPDECYVVMDRSTGESRGFGFVTYHSMDEAKQAVSGMNGKELDGRRIKVDISKPKGTSAPEPQGCKLYIGNLGYDTSAEDLKHQFAQYGELTDLTVVTDRETGSSRGFAFATYTNPDDASAAVRELDGFEVDGRQLRVNLSKPKEARSNDFGGGGGGGGYGGGRGGGGGGGGVDACKVFVGNLGWDTTQDALQAAFSQYGQLSDVKLVTDRDTGNSRGFAFVTFRDQAGAESAIANLDATELDGREIRVNISQPKKPRYQETAYDDDSW